MPCKAYVFGAGAVFYVGCSDDDDGQALKTAVLKLAPDLGALNRFNLYHGKALLAGGPPPTALLVDVGERVVASLPPGVEVVGGRLNVCVERLAGTGGVAAGGVATGAWRNVRRAQRAGSRTHDGSSPGAVCASRPRPRPRLCSRTLR